MPELPEVETTRRGIAPHIIGCTVTGVVVREARLRWQVPARLAAELQGETVLDVARRGKYLLIMTARGTVIVHLGMSGSLRIVPAGACAGKHDHVDIVFNSQQALRLHDPRRFGCLLWTRGQPKRHKLLRDLGPEPLGDEFSGAYLYQRARDRRLAIKQFLMNSHTVAGLGNIYVNEALFLAGINPKRAAGRISLSRYLQLAAMIRKVLNDSIRQGGTTLRNFVNDQGEPGYFKLQLRVYGRGGEPCRICSNPLHEIRQGQRSTFYCPRCQR